MGYRLTPTLGAPAVLPQTVARAGLSKYTQTSTLACRPRRHPAESLHMLGTTDRRHFFKHAMAGAAVSLPGLSFLSQLRAKAPEMKKKQKNLIILWMSGGPATIDLWDMKPGSPNGGQHKP